MASVLYLWFFGPQTFFALSARRMGRQAPIANSTPAELRDTAISSVRGSTISFDGIEFEVPWAEYDREKSKVVGSWALLHFLPNRTILLCVAQPKSFMNDTFKQKEMTPELLTSLYGPDVLDSDYNVKRAIYGTTPSEITLFTPSGRAAGLASIVLIKSIMAPTTDWAIYNVQGDEFRGIQLGDPIRRPRKMCIELYAKDDFEFEFNLEQTATGPTPAILQSELNRIIQTAKRVSPAEPSIKVTPQ